MDASVSVHRPRPQNLSLSFGGSLSDLKAYTASLKPPTCDWISNCRGITSATLRYGSAEPCKTSYDRASLEREFRDQIALLKRQNELLQARSNTQIDKVLETDSDNNSSENLTGDSFTRNSNSGSHRSRNSSRKELELTRENRSNSHKSSPTVSPGVGKTENEGSNKEAISELLNNKIMILEKTQQIERLESEVKRLTEERSNESQEKMNLVVERDSLRAGLENKDTELLLVQNERDNLNKTIQALNKELNQYKAKYTQLSLESCFALSNLSSKDTKIGTLEAEIQALLQEQEESRKVFQQIHEAKVLINEFNEKSELPSQNELIPALEALLGDYKKSQETLKENINVLEGEITNKNLHIEALISDVNQMKEFIVEHHGVSVFEGEEKDEMEAAKEEDQITETTEFTEATEATEQEILIIPDEKEETPKNKVTVYIEQPMYRTSSYRGYYDRDYYQRDSYDRRRPYRNSSRPWNDDLVIYQPKTSSQGFEEKEREEQSSTYKNKETKVEVTKESKFEPFKDRKTREEDPVYKQLETMIKELNEKLINNEKKAKKFCEEKLLEASRLQLEREETLLAEVEKLKEDKKGLLKKIDDMQWEQAYEFTQKAKLEKQEEEKTIEAANKQKIASLEANKKKKKK